MIARKIISIIGLSGLLANWGKGKLLLYPLEMLEIMQKIMRTNMGVVVLKSGIRKEKLFHSFRQPYT